MAPSDLGAADDSAVVHKAGSETITGDKDFTGAVTKSGVNLITKIQDAADVAIATPAQGDTLTYDPTSGKWKNGSGGSLTAFNVKDYGAKGHGITDDTLAIQAAINAAQATGFGGTVWFPTGRYLVTSTLTVTANGIALRGAGGMHYEDTLGNEWNGGATLVAGTPGMTMLKLDGGANILQGGAIIEALHFEEPAHANTATLVQLQMMNHWTLRDCSFSAGAVQLLLSTPDIAGADSSWGIVDHCNFNNGTTGIELTNPHYVDTGGSVPAVKIVGGSIITAVGGTGISVPDPNAFTRIIDTKFDVNGGVGVSVVGGAYMTIDAQFELHYNLTGAVGIEVNPSTAWYGRGIEIGGQFYSDQGNTNNIGVVVDCTADIVNRAQSITIRGANFGSLLVGVDVKQAKGILISDVDFISCATGLHLEAGSDRAVVTGVGLSSCTVGILIDATAPSTIIASGYAFNTATPLTDNGTNTVCVLTRTFQNHVLATGAGHTVDDVITLLQALLLCKQA